MDAEKKYLDMIDEGSSKGPYRDDWSSLTAMRVPSWFDEERLGIFTHWGLYSIPAFANEWYSRNMYIEGSPEYEHHIKTYGPHKDFGYKDFIPMFKAENFDPDEWMQLFKDAGAGYVFPVAEHHDGFQMYDSELSEWNAAKMGPKRDFIKELRAAALKAGLHFCASTHRAEHWFFMGNGKKFESDIKDPMKKGDFYWPAMPDVNFEDLFSEPAPTEEYLNDWMARTAELIVKYEPELLYFDWWIQHQAFRPYLRKLAAFYYNFGAEKNIDVSMCYKLDAFAFGAGIPEVERGGFADVKPFRWQTDTAAARNSWCHTDSLIYKTGREIVTTLVDVVSKNGNLMLNVGPRADGAIPDGDRRILSEIGAWMKVNREAVNGTRPWRRSSEGPTKNREGQFQDSSELEYTSEDYRFTAKGDVIYAICMKCPADGRFTVRSMRDSFEQEKRDCHLIIDSISIPGYDGQVGFSVDEEALHVEAPGVTGDMPVVLKIKTR